VGINPTPKEQLLQHCYVVENISKCNAPIYPMGMVAPREGLMTKKLGKFVGVVVSLVRTEVNEALNRNLGPLMEDINALKATQDSLPLALMYHPRLSRCSMKYYLGLSS